ncbi:hypothetical protein M3I54_40300 [Paraburkholderia sp. CNPSo 3274]|uniref:hypothetical protein n=1 Tax=Paraburkholderia sp. CNPSo 3274 TaxID=2940932 RepID=UPI0020B79369|nr:hypothetical protein [Paraburkholderia sp. CNPSo 3274]MCP3713057.1 hypothetical protein [Paraburkholderia sp. CNPSo 3274]
MSKLFPTAMSVANIAMADCHRHRDARRWFTAAEAPRDALSCAVSRPGKGTFAAAERKLAAQAAPEAWSENVDGGKAAVRVP